MDSVFRRASLFLWGMTSLMVVAVPAWADTLNNVSQLKPGSRIFSYLFSKEQTSEMYHVGVYWDKKLSIQQECKGQFRVKPISLSLVKAIEFPDDRPHPVQGAWKHRFEFERCGQMKIYNAVFISKNGEKPDVKPYFPGVTNASLLLVSDATKAAYPIASIKLVKQQGIKECKDLELIDMRITQQPHNVVEGTKVFTGVWQENWSFRGCGASVDVNVDFTPDGKGGAYYSVKDK